MPIILPVGRATDFPRSPRALMAAACGFLLAIGVAGFLITGNAQWLVAVPLALAAGLVSYRLRP